MLEKKDQTNDSMNIFISVAAVLAILLALMVLLLGESILQTLGGIYPSWAFPVYFISWFLLIISSVQKLNKNKEKSSHALQVWILKTTIPLFIFTLPFFSQFLSVSIDAKTCLDNCIPSHEVVFGFEPYCMVVAIVSLFLLHLLPGKYLHNK